MLVGHPALGLTDVMSVVLPTFSFQPSVHVHYGEKVLSMRDGLPKFKDMPKDFGGSGEMLPRLSGAAVPIRLGFYGAGFIARMHTLRWRRARSRTP